MAGGGTRVAFASNPTKLRPGLFWEQNSKGFPGFVSVQTGLEQPELVPHLPGPREDARLLLGGAAPPSGAMEGRGTHNPTAPKPLGFTP